MVRWISGALSRPITDVKLSSLSAYEILSDAEKKKIYDQFGLEYLLRGGTSPPPPSPGNAGGVPPFMRSGTFPGAAFPGGSAGNGGGHGSRFSFPGFGGSFNGQFNPSNPSHIFEQFVRGGGIDPSDGFDGFNFSSSPLGGNRSRAREPPMGRSKTPESTILEKHIGFTLEESVEPLEMPETWTAILTFS